MERVILIWPFMHLSLWVGWSPAVLSECHAGHMPHTRTGGQPNQPLWINTLFSEGGSSPTSVLLRGDLGHCPI